ncbi:hypothetical protein ABPG72_013144 [Tetrahymena utriculariae]
MLISKEEKNTNCKLSFEKKAWEILDKQDFQNLKKSTKMYPDCFKELSISLKGSSIREKSALNSLIDEIYLEVNFGYLNVIEVDTFQVLFNNISTLGKLQQLSLTFDSQKSIKYLKLELQDINLKNTQMTNLTNELCKLTKLQQLDLNLKDSETPIDFKSIVQNLFFLNLDALSLTLERCQNIESESNFCIIDNQQQRQQKDISLRFVEIENIDDIVRSIYSQLNCFQNLENFKFYLDKVKGLENLQIDKQNWKKELSNLKNINVEIQSSVVSTSLLNYILNNAFYDHNQIIISIGSYKINVESFGEVPKTSKFVYDSFKNEDFLNQIKEFDIFSKQNQLIKKLQLQEINNSQFSLKRNISIDELFINQTINQDSINSLAQFFDLIDTNSLNIFKLQLINNQNQQLNSHQFVKNLIKLTKMLYLTSFDVSFDLTNWPYISEIRDKSNQFTIQEKSSNQPFTILKQLLRNLKDSNLNINLKVKLNGQQVNMLSEDANGIQQDNTSIEQSILFDFLPLCKSKKELHLYQNFDFKDLKYKKDIPIDILKIDCCKNFELSNILQRFTNIQQLDIKMKVSEDVQQIQLFLLEVLNLSSLISFIIQIKCSYSDKNVLKLWLQDLNKRELQIKQMRTLKIKINGEKVFFKNLLRKSKRLVIQ